MILSGRFDLSKLFNSDKILVRVSQYIMDNIEEGLNIILIVNDKNNKMKVLFFMQEMELYMMIFYVQNLKFFIIYGFLKIVVENYSIFDIIDDGGRRLSYIGENYRGKKNYFCWLRFWGIVNFIMDKCFFFGNILCVGKKNIGLLLICI